MTAKSRSQDSLSEHGPMCDDCLSLETRIKPRQTINIACRAMVDDGILIRAKDICPRCRATKIVNRLKGSTASVPWEGQVTNIRSSQVDKPIKNHDVEGLSEDEIKQALVDWLSKDGWKSTVAWGNTRGIDVEAKRGEERWVIEVKGPGSRQPMRVNYFISILGETLQRMDDPASNYSIALPDLPQYRGLWERLPRLAKSRTKISIIFVSVDGDIELDGVD